MRPGDVIGDRFEIEREAGAGGMGTVYQARDRRTGAPVAVKVMLPGSATARFAQEVAVLARFDDPAVVRFVAHGSTTEGRAFLAMEWLDGEDLGARISRGALTIDATIAVARGAASALAMLHARGVVHRDVKPDNLFLVGRAAEQVKLLDFGIARACEGPRLTAPGTMMGTPAYMAPEQVRGADDVDARADVWALGCVLFECLTGAPPFIGANVMAILGKVLLQAVPLVGAVRPDTPRWLASLVDRMLSKEVDGRPVDARAVIQDIDAARNTLPPPARPSAIGLVEQRVKALLLASVVASDDATIEAEELDLLHATATRIIEQRGGQLERVVGGGWLATFGGGTSPVDAASRAARAALSLSKIAGAVAIATGRAVVGKSAQVGEVIDRAARILTKSQAPVVYVDAITQSLLEGRFDFAADEAGPWVVAERRAPDLTRRLLGRATPFVGRQAELATLRAIVHEVIEDSAGQGVLVTGSPGMGKSRLVGELLRAAGELGFLVLSARGEMGGAYSVLQGVISSCLQQSSTSGRGRAALAERLARIAPEAGSALLEPLAEVIGDPVPEEEASEALRAARRDHVMMRDAVGQAWCTWLLAESSIRPVMVFVDDLDLSDRTSALLLDMALRASIDHPILILVTGRPELCGALTRLVAGGLVRVVPLGPIEPEDAGALVRSVLGPETSDDVVRSLVARVEGHPFFLEEVLRAVGAGGRADALPDTVLALVESRLDRLSDEDRRTLRAASVFGTTFWQGGVAALLEAPSHAVAESLERLKKLEMIELRSSSTFDDELEYGFSAPLLREAAYATLLEADRRAAHAICGGWLESRHLNAPLVIATHLARGGAGARAAQWYRIAASQALDGGDLALALAAADHALESETDRTLRGRLHILQAEARYWRGDASGAEALAHEAGRGFDRGSVDSFNALALLAASAGQRQGIERIVEVARQAVAEPIAKSSAARDAQLLCLGRVLGQLAHAHRHADADAVLSRIDAICTEHAPRDPLAGAWVERGRGDAVLVKGMLHTAATAQAASQGLFERAGARRYAIQSRTHAAGALAVAGLCVEAAAVLEPVLRAIDGLGMPLLTSYAMHTNGLILTYRGPNPEAIGAFEAAIASSGGHARLTTWSHVQLSWLHTEAGALVAATTHARAAIDASTPGWLRSIALASHAQCLRLSGDTAKAVTEAEAAIREEAATEVSFFDFPLAVPQLALAEALAAVGDRAGADRALVAAVTRLLAFPELVDRPERRAAFLGRAWPNARILALADARGLRTT